MTKRPNGAGSISRSRNSLQVRIPLADGRRATVGTFKLDQQAEAEDLLQATLEELARTDYATVGGLTLCHFGRQVLDERELSGDVRDIDGERGRFEFHIAESDIGKMPLRAITARDVGVWFRELRGKTAAGTRGGNKISRKTVAEVVRLLKMVFAAACSPEHALLDTSPAEWLRVKRELRTEDPWDYFREKEISTVRACEAIPELDRLIILFAIATGLRLGEQMNLHLVDLVVDGDRPEVVVRYGSKGKPPKNGKIRRIPLFGLGLEVARDWLARLPSYAPKNPEGLVFPTRTGARRQPGKHLHASRWDKATKTQIKVDRFKEHLAAAGITRPFRWHDLRHTCASALVSGWWGRSWSLEETREYMGHVSLQSTLRYAHLDDTALHRAARETHAAGVEAQAEVVRVAAARAFKLAGGTAAVGCALAASEVLSISEMPIFEGVGRQGLEPWTYGLKALLGPESSPTVETPRSQVAADPVEVLRALARGDADAARAGGRALAEQVLGSAAVRAAVEVLRGGEHVDRRIAELCESVLEAGNVAAAKRGAA